MKIEDIKNALSATMIYCPEEGIENEYGTVCACDMMSELLAIMNRAQHDNSGIFLLTGLTNPQVIRTSEMVDIHLIIFLRNKLPTPDTIELARDCGITLLSTPHTMFKSCGLLYQMNLNDVQLEKRYV